ERKQLPTLEQLISEELVGSRSKATDLIVLLNQNPPKNWIAKHPFINKEIINEQGQKIKVPFEYLPINKVEFLLNKIFIHYKIEVVKTGMLLNSVECHVRVHYKHPITEEWMFHDGVGAQEVQTKKDTGSLQMDMSNINKSAIQMALPIAKTLAIKDACDHFGKIFGSDLNRRDGINYDSLLTQKTIIEVNDEKEKQRAIDFINNCNSKKALESMSNELLEKYDLLDIYDFKLQNLS
ncbi:MAG TPA: hypothetical protein VIK86_06425, partial [Candidatus Paceibacterota bacterium]